MIRPRALVGNFMPIWRGRSEDKSLLDDESLILSCTISSKSIHVTIDS